MAGPIGGANWSRLRMYSSLHKNSATKLLSIIICSAGRGSQTLMFLNILVLLLFFLMWSIRFDIDHFPMPNSLPYLPLNSPRPLVHFAPQFAPDTFPIRPGHLFNSPRPPVQFAPTVFPIRPEHLFNSPRLHCSIRPYHLFCPMHVSAILVNTIGVGA